MVEYIQVAEDEGEEVLEIPIEDDGTLLLSTLTAQFPGSCGLRFRNPDTGSFRGIKLSDGKLYPPEDEGGWFGIPFVAVYPKMSDGTDLNSGDNKRKGEQCNENPEPKTKKVERIKCSDLIVLGLDYNTNEDSMRGYFSNFGPVVFCEVKKNFETGKSRGYGFVRFMDYSIQRHVLQQRHEIDGRMCDVKIPASKESDHLSRRVFVGRVPETMTDEDLRCYFKQFGDVKEIYLPKPYRPFAFITFTDPEVANSLLGEDHIVRGTSLMVRSAAPRVSDKLGSFDYTSALSNAGIMSTSPSVPSSDTTTSANQHGLNPQAIFAAALSQAAQQAVRAAQNTGWPGGQQPGTGGTLNQASDPQVAAAVQAILGSNPNNVTCYPPAQQTTVVQPTRQNWG